jgi:hypothetical protein
VPDSRALFLGSHQGGFYITGWHIAPLRDEDGSELPLNPNPFNTGFAR